MAREPAADGGKRLADSAVLLRRYRQHLRVVIGMLWDDYERRGTQALNIELDSAHALEWDIQVRPIRAAHYRQAPVGYDKPAAFALGLDLNLLVGVKQLCKQLVAH
ncbi:MAG TPA: hypothetical protein VIF08_03775 [Candidatus Limnocylindrales bacterium]|jgi:hypothetical protein